MVTYRRCLAWVSMDEIDKFKIKVLAECKLILMKIKKYI